MVKNIHAVQKPHTFLYEFFHMGSSFSQSVLVVMFNCDDTRIASQKFNHLSEMIDFGLDVWGFPPLYYNKAVDDIVLLNKPLQQQFFCENMTKSFDPKMFVVISVNA